MLESMMIVAPRTRRPGPMARPTDDPLRVARVCYDHLAGRLGTRITHALAQRRVLRAVGTELTLTAAGEVWCASFGMDTAALRAARRRFAYPCFDWTERRHHVGGAFGAALAERLLGLGWIARTRESRVLSVTPLGRRALTKQLGVRLS